MIEQKLFRVPPDSILRCQAIVENGQCPYQVVEGQKMCPMHMRGSIEQKREVRNYRLSKWQARVNDFADNDKVKSLREEIGLIRMILEEMILKCQEPTDLLIYSSRISDLVMKVEKLVSSCHRLELSTGLLLDKAAILQVAGTMVEIIGKYVKDDIVIDVISKEFLKTITDSNPANTEVK